MSCPGLHCPGCTGKQSIGVLAAVVAVAWIADETVQWVAERIWWIGGTIAACFALATAASMWLERLSDARCARFAERRGIASRADVDELTPAGIAWLLAREQQRPAVGPAVVNFNFYGAASPEQVRTARTAIPGTAGDAISSKERDRQL
jgi:hypothetical protein